MEERIQKLLSACGEASRRTAEEWIRQGRVTINGRAAVIGEKADLDRDRICVDGRPVKRQDKKVYIMLNKPVGYVTTLSDERGRRTVADLVKDCGARVYPVGRLDLNSQGLLLLTNDGELAHRIMHPSTQVWKRYEVLVSGATEASLKALGEPMELDGVPLAPIRLARLGQEKDGELLSISIREGRNRQIRRMCQQLGMSVLRLTRMAEGDLLLGDLKLGRWRHLTEGEVRRLRSL